MRPERLDHGTIVAFIADILERRGADSYLGEAVTMSQHMLQVALLAEREGAGEELVAAALLHDIGHYTSEFGADASDRGLDNRHEEAGARVLRAYFPDSVSECVRLHVPAKRYLCAVEPGYFATLSPASVHSLALQGGPMPADEVAAFERQPHHREAVRVRQWDEGGKRAGISTPGFSHYAPLLRRVVARHRAQSR
ncbi:MAG: HD domain-containing protein [Proteobacteria bacterium]|nr:HD domain-containing protein [Pseudomonadota bacterium]MBI3500096.1 HD domain-containing protein [Pseudomonadota bacterium]